MPSIVLYQPEIAANTGSILRLAACMGVAVHIIEPCGFPFDHARFRRAGMDYLDKVSLFRHAGWKSFCAALPSDARLVLVDVPYHTSLYHFHFKDSDMLLFGNEGHGVPADIAESCNTSIGIPMQPGARSLNLAIAAGMAIGEAVRQLTWQK